VPAAYRQAANNPIRLLPVLFPPRNLGPALKARRSRGDFERSQWREQMFAQVRGTPEHAQGGLGIGLALTSASRPPLRLPPPAFSSIREELHQWIRKITLAEFQSGLVLLAMTFIALPVVPDRSVGPFGGVNLREVWIIAIVLASVSFAGCLAVKLLGERHGVLVAAATGGLVSSTAVTLANARRAAAGEGAPRLLAAGVALAAAVAFVRVLPSSPR
jgi:hypothetical protein